MVGSIAEDGAVEPILRDLISALVRVYETVRRRVHGAAMRHTHSIVSSLHTTLLSRGAFPGTHTSRGARSTARCSQCVCVCVLTGTRHGDVRVCVSMRCAIVRLACAPPVPSTR